jgi:hypothetical protein
LVSGSLENIAKKPSKSLKKIEAILLFKTGSFPVILFSRLNSMLKKVIYLLKEEYFG